MSHDLAMLGLFGKKRIYLDYAGATPVSKQAARAYARAAQLTGNPGAIHGDGVAAKRALTNAREKVAGLLGCKSREIIFTSGATEANNLAILGHFKYLILHGKKPASTHWIVSAIEHPSVLSCFDHIVQVGGNVTYLEPDSRGIVSAEKVAAVLTLQTALVSIAWSNSETGVVQPIHKIAETIRAFETANKTEVLFHSDAGQSPLYIKSHVHELGVDMLTLDSGKLYGPRGVGALYISNRVALSPAVVGGGQERGLRAGTENVAGACGFAAAFGEIAGERECEARRLRALRDSLVQELLKHMSDVMVNTDIKHSLPHILGISIPGEKTGEYLALQLDAAGISVATKSACREGEGSISHVVAVLGGPEWRAKNTLRISLGSGTSVRDISALLAQLQKLV